MRTFEIGGQIVLTTVFTNAETCEATDPSTVLLQVMDPNGTVSTVATSNPSTGCYKALFTPAIPGIWTVRWSGTGAVTAASEEKFEVRPSAFVS